MKVTVRRITDWSLALDVARNTMGKEERNREPSSDWKRRMLLAEHSPIRAVMYHIRLDGVPYFVSVHLVRHKHGVEHYVRSQRSDRTGVVRDKLPQDAPVVHDMVANAQAILQMSRKRLCNLAAKETREAWRAVVDELRNIGEVELADACVPECVHQGNRCPELKGCGRCSPIYGTTMRKNDTTWETERHTCEFVWGLCDRPHEACSSCEMNPQGKDNRKGNDHGLEDKDAHA